ncbi:LysE family translocator [Vibrio sp. SCSIO 43137]|uniref:LysE family translocator n=1 Tax=Vibrio sp. SCSIO 43137 TaxID=3021011 RepID=UPI00230811A7|nr:LysE family translocator [Vibrio sp. SCSIO 43137]WCE32302.1 LysE family translocator [Vibrio sp. SCSIO 43137]
MSSQIILAFLFFSVSMSLTPGAGNLALMGISNRYGFLAALPFVAGTACGVLIVFSGTSAGLITLLTDNPQLYMALKYLGAAYLLYIAWGISRSTIEDNQSSENRSGFMSGTLIQVLNPKAWIAAMTVFSQFTSNTGDYLTQVVTITTAFLLVMTLCTLVWAYFGSVLKQLLRSQKQMLIVNRCLGSTLAATVCFMLVQP